MMIESDPPTPEHPLGEVIVAFDTWAVGGRRYVIEAVAISAELWLMRIDPILAPNAPDLTWAQTRDGLATWLMGDEVYLDPRLADSVIFWLVTYYKTLPTQ